MVHVQGAGTGGSNVSKTQWTFMCYMAGDNSLSAAADNDLAEMRQVGSTKDVNIVVEIDRAGNNQTWRYKVERNGEGELREKLPETDSGDPETLFKFVEWAQAKYPAEHYCLVIWNHGGGWEPSEMDRIARHVGTVSYSGRETVARTGSELRRSLFRPTIEQVYRLPTVHQRAIASDDGTGHSLDTVELGKVMARLRGVLGQPIDVLGLDACLMSSLEVAWELKESVRYMVGSLDNEPNDGWPYDEILGQLTMVPDVSSLAFAASITYLYAQSYTSHNRNITQSAFDLSKIDDLEMPLGCLSKALLKDMAGVRGQMYRAQTRSVSFWASTLWDLGDWCHELRNLNPSQHVDHATKCVMDALDVGGFVIANEHQGQAVRNVSGLSIYLPPETKRISPYYDDLAFAKDMPWQSVLYAYHNGGREEPEPRGGPQEESPWLEHQQV